MLYRPNFMYPDINGSDGSGVIDATKENTFSAIVSGDSPVVAYRIGVFKNNAESTLVYQSGVVDISDNPFYNTDINGDSVPFTYTVPANTTSGNEIANGLKSGYKYILTLWWDLDTSNYEYGCVESFETVFYAKSDPALTIESITANDETFTLTNNTTLTIDSSQCIFAAKYVQSDNSGLRWFRWTLAHAEDLEDIVAQTEKIYNSPLIQYMYDGFINNASYAIMCEVQTQDGLIIKSDWVIFNVKYQEITISSAINLELTEDNGIRIDVSKIQYIQGVPTENASYGFSNNIPVDEHNSIYLHNAESSVTFSDSEHFSLDFNANGECVISFAILDDSDEILYLADEENSHTLKVSHVGTKDGLSPSVMLAPSTTLAPSNTNNGYFVIEVDGEEAAFINSSYIKNTWFVLCFSFDLKNITLYETPYKVIQEEL